MAPLTGCAETCSKNQRRMLRTRSSRLSFSPEPLTRSRASPFPRRAPDGVRKERGTNMPITDKLFRLGSAARQLNDGSDQLNRLVSEIDQVLGRLMIGLDYVHPRPLHELVAIDGDGKRVTELAFVGYLKVQGGYHLAIKTVKVLEAKSQAATEQPGALAPLLSAPRRLRHAAVDLLPEVVSGLAAQVDEVVGSMERRCATAKALLDHLHGVEDSGVRPVALASPKPATPAGTKARHTQPVGTFESS